MASECLMEKLQLLLNFTLERLQFEQTPLSGRSCHQIIFGIIFKGWLEVFSAKAKHQAIKKRFFSCDAIFKFLWCPILQFSPIISAQRDILKVWIILEKLQVSLSRGERCDLVSSVDSSHFHSSHSTMLSPNIDQDEDDIDKENAFIRYWPG